MTFQEYKINQARKIFIGNLDRETVVRHILSPVIYARFVRFHPNTWNVRICMRVEVYSYGRDFPADLGIEDKEVQDSQLTASSEFDYQHATYMGRLNYQLGIAISWTAKYMNTNQWFQFDLGHTMLVTGVVTQGRGSGDYIQYVKAYKIRYSLDNTYWVWYKEYSQVKVFPGNSDVTSYVTNMFNRDVKARSIRINPTSWQLYISLRASVIGRRKGKLGSPVFTNQKAPSYITVYKNHDVTLNCETVGDTPITVTWTHKGKVLHTNQTHLTLSNVNTTQEGFYNCNATNR
ncbi:lactadherin, partial [Exaiptasia diaphana]|uniref:Uncharacterized protein n=1 Tax=Exaiptasia diaphana TaxID=2652724 RepID=A0A913YT77_EXADI